MFKFIHSNTIRQIIREQTKYRNQYQQLKTEVFQKPTYRIVNKKKITSPIHPLLTHK